MLKLSTKVRYGTRFMLNLALNYSKRTTKLRKIAEEEDVPIHYLEQIVIPLKNSGLVRSVRGAGGGFVLTRHPSRVKMSEIIYILEGSWCLVECVEDAQYCSRIKECVAVDLWEEMSQSLTRILEKTTLEDMVKRYEKKRHQSL